ncbi:MAG: hypothetical protein HY996_12155 [Micrococcales bacterium]|nr:hypothetical protein [Micrococcales bacterium]
MTDARRRDARRPLELLGLSAGVAVAIGLVVLGVTRSAELAGLWAGVAFVVILVVVAMLALASGPERDRGEDGEGPSGH